jgi:integrase
MTKADTGSVTVKRDYALFLFYTVTCLRRSEGINLRSSDIEEESGTLILYVKVLAVEWLIAGRSSPHSYLDMRVRQRQ